MTKPNDVDTAPGKAGPPEPISLTVVGGFLGAGKTTLLNDLLRHVDDRRLAVVVNDFGAINIDAELVEERDGEMVTLRNGCICCGASGDFIRELAFLRDRADSPEHVVIETSGVADPGAIVALGTMPGYRKDAVVVVADAETVQERAGDEVTGHLLTSQLRAADLLVLNKIDLVAADRLSATRTWLREVVGRSTAIVDTSFGEVPVDVVLGARPAGGASAGPSPAVRGHFAHGGDEADPRHPRFETWSWSGDVPISGATLVEELKALPDGIVRAKGLLHLTEDRAHRYVLQVVGRRFSIEADRPWGGQAPSSQIVIIGLPGSVDREQLDAAVARLTEQGGSAGHAGGRLVEREVDATHER